MHKSSAATDTCTEHAQTNILHESDCLRKIPHIHNVPIRERYRVHGGALECTVKEGFVRGLIELLVHREISICDHAILLGLNAQSSQTLDGCIPTHSCNAV